MRDEISTPTAKRGGWPPDDGEMARRIRGYDWAATPFGPIDDWPQSLQKAISGELGVEPHSPSSEVRRAYLLDLSDRLRLLDDPAEITGVATRALGEALNASRAYYVEWPPDAEFGEVARDFVVPGLASLAGRYPIDTFRSAFERISTGSTWVVEDAATATELSVEERSYYMAHGVAAWIDVPLLKRGRVQAALCLVQAEPRHWSPDEITIVEETADRCWATIERVVVERVVRSGERQQAFLLDLNDAVAAISDPVEIQAVAARLLGTHLTVQRAGYGEVEDECVVVRADFADGLASLVGRYPIEAFGQHLALAYREGGTVVVRNAASDADLSDGERKQLSKLNVAAHVTIAIRKAGQPVISLGVQAEAPRDWTNEEIALIRDVAERTWAAVVRSRAEAALRKSERHAQTLLAELQHRVRNTLAVVRSMARRTAELTQGPVDFMSHFEGRLNAFSRVQAVVTRSASGAVDLKSLVEDELLGLAIREGEHLRIDGPKICFTPRAAESMSLAVHELATNAVKYGAITAPHGKIHVSWHCEPGETSQVLHFEWRELGLTTKPACGREGFGHELLLRSLPYDLGATTQIAFEEDGFYFRMSLPLGTDVVVQPSSSPGQ